MWQQFQPALGEPADWLGDWHPLVEQLGSANGLGALSELSASMRATPVHDLPSLCNFLVAYQQKSSSRLNCPPSNAPLTTLAGMKSAN